MDDSFLNHLRRDPPAQFARQLWIQLENLDPVRGFAWNFPALRRLTAAVALLILVVFACAFPQVRAAAQAFLDLFRVSNFAAVPVSDERLSTLRAAHLDVPELVAGQVEELTRPGPPVSYATIEAAGSAAGIHVHLPAWRPVGWELSEIRVLGARSVRVTVSVAKLRQILQNLGLRDVEVPEDIDGKTALVRTSPVVGVSYQNAGSSVIFLQTRTPNVQFPAGLDLSALGEIGLRVLGLDAAEAHRFAQSIDWRTTLVVPVPVSVVSFRNVDVQGHPGLMIQTAAAPVGPRAPAPKGAGGAGRPRGETLLLWSTGDQVFGLKGRMWPPQLLEMAQSLQ